MLTAIVTGGSSGFGAGISKKLGSQNIAVVIADIVRAQEESWLIIQADEQGRVIADQIIEAGGQAIVVKSECNCCVASLCAADVTSRQSWDAAVQLAVQTYGGVNFIINNAGGAPAFEISSLCLTQGTYQSKPVYETTEADFDKCIDLNLRSIFHSVHSGFPALQAARKAGQPAAVINIASTGGVRGRPGLTWYSASKAAAISVTQSLAQEFAAEQIVSPLTQDSTMR